MPKTTKATATGTTKQRPRKTDRKSATRRQAKRALAATASPANAKAGSVTVPIRQSKKAAILGLLERPDGAAISDLTAAGDTLTWDQATYMPRGGADARARQCAALYRLAHEQAVAPALGKLLDALVRFGESLRRDKMREGSTTFAEKRQPHDGVEHHQQVQVDRT